MEDNSTPLVFHDPLKPIPPSRHPFQFLVMISLAVAGGSVAFTGHQPDSVDSLIPNWQGTAWGLTMFLGGVLAVTSSFWPDRIMGLLMERVSLGAIGGTCGFYAVALYLVYGVDSGPISLLIFVAITAACGWRLVHIRRELHLLSRWIERWNEEE